MFLCQSRSIMVGEPDVTGPSQPGVSTNAELDEIGIHTEPERQKLADEYANMPPEARARFDSISSNPKMKARIEVAFGKPESIVNETTDTVMSAITAEAPAAPKTTLQPKTREDLLREQKQAELDRVAKIPTPPTREELLKGVSQETQKVIADWKKPL